MFLLKNQERKSKNKWIKVIINKDHKCLNMILMISETKKCLLRKSLREQKEINILEKINQQLYKNKTSQKSKPRSLFHLLLTINFKVWKQAIMMIIIKKRYFNMILSSKIHKDNLLTNKNLMIYTINKNKNLESSLVQEKLMNY